MGNRGKVVEQQRARELRAQSWTLLEIARELGVSKSSASLWARGVNFVPKPRNRGHASNKPHPMAIEKQLDIQRSKQEADAFVGSVSNRDLTMFALALYAGEGSKREGSVVFANSDAVLMRIFVTWLRSAFELDEARMRMRLYLHADLDLDAAVEFWSDATGVPPAQFGKPYRAVVDETRRLNRHIYGCASVVYSSTPLHRRVMAMIAAVTSQLDNPG